MKLSMWILADWLLKFSPRLEIKNGTATISGLRFITGELACFSPDYLYVGRAVDAFSDQHYNNAMILVHQYDIMFFYETSLDDLLNEILLAFDYYNNWESELLTCIYQAEPIQAMVSASQKIFDCPIIVMNRTGEIIAYSTSYSRDAFNDFWRELVDTRMSPTSQFGTKIITKDGKELSSWTDTPQIYLGSGLHPDYVSANINIDDEFVGAFLLLGFNCTFQQNHCQLAERLCTAITQAASLNSGDFELPSSSLVFKELLDGTPPTQQQIRQMSESWNPPWHLAVIKSIQSQSTNLRKNTSLNKIRGMAVHTISLLYESEITVIINANNVQSFLHQLESVLNPNYYSMGFSLQFSTWNDLPERRKQALFAMDRNQNKSGVFFCKDYAFDHMLTAYKSLNQELLMLHPAPRDLAEYDRIHKTEFCKTLYVYLTNERNTVSTAAALHVHRNTLLYRIKKIMEIINTTLDDPEERIYIQLSYKLDSVSEFL